MGGKTMYSKLIAMSWEYYRKNRWWTLGLMLALASVGALMLPFSESAHDDPHACAGVLVAIESLGIMYFMLWAQYDCTTQRLGFDLHHYAQPIGTLPLVLWQLLLRLFNAGLLHAWVFLIIGMTQSNALIAELYSIEVFLLVIWLNALIWMFPHYGWLQRILGIAVFFSTALATFLIYLGIQLATNLWGRSEFHLARQILGAVHQVPELYFDPFIVRIKLVLLLVGSILAWWAITQDRRDQSLSLRQIQAWRLNRQLNVTPHHSPLSAIFWMEFKRKGLHGIIVNIIYLMILWNACLMGLPYPMVGTFICILAITNVLVYPVIMGIQLGQHGGNSFLMESYKSTRPITTTTLIKSYLRVAITCLALMWGICILGIAPLLYYIASVTNSALGIGDYFIRLKGEIPLWLLIAIGWTGMGISASIMSAGRKWVAITFWLGIWMIPLVLSLIYEFILSEFGSRHLQEAYNSILLILGISLTIGGTSLAYVKAWKKELLDLKVIIGVLILLFLTALFGWRKGELVVSLAVACLLLAPLATTPLALAWNRHR